MEEVVCDIKINDLIELDVDEEIMKSYPKYLKMKYIIISMFFTWLNENYSGLIYFSKLFSQLAVKRHNFFLNFQSSGAPDIIILHKNNQYSAMAIYLIMNTEGTYGKEKKRESIKKLVSMNYFAIEANNINQIKNYFLEYLNNY